MKTPTTRFTARVLAALLIGAGTSFAAQAPDDVSGAYWSSPDNTWRAKDGKPIPSDDFVGPPASDQIRRNEAVKSLGPGLGSPMSALTDNSLLQMSGNMAYSLPTSAANAASEGWTELPGSNGIPSWVKEEGGKYIHALCASIPCRAEEYDAKACAESSRCPAELKRYAESKDTARRDKGMFKSNMFAADAGGDKNTPDSSSDERSAPKQDDDAVAANSLGNDIGDQFLGGDQWRQSPDSGAGNDGRDGGAGDSTAAQAEVGKAEVPALSGVHYTYPRLEQTAKWAEADVKKFNAALADPSGKTLDDKTPKNLVVTPQNQNQ